MAKQEWGVLKSGGTLGRIIGVPLNDQAASECSRWIERGQRWIVVRDISATIEVGRAAHKLKILLGMDCFKKVVVKYWLPPGAKYEAHERTFQEATQIFRFATRKGPKLRRDIPKDSYRKLMAYVLSVKSTRRQSRLIRQINDAKTFDGVELSDTKALRKKLSRVRTGIGQSDDPTAVDYNFNMEFRKQVGLSLRNYSALVNSSRAAHKILKNGNPCALDKRSIQAAKRVRLLMGDPAELVKKLKNLEIRCGIALELLEAK